MRQYRFYKDENGWFIDLKNFPYGKSKWKWMLAMVAGADTLLDILSEGKDEIKLQIDTAPIPYSNGHLEKHVSLGFNKGAFYFSRDGYLKDHNVSSVDTVWLCPVTLWVFWKYPKKIYYKIVE